MLILRMYLLSAIAFLGAGGVALAWTTPDPDERERTEAQEYERLGQWERACEAYLRLLGENRNQQDVRARVALCLRRLHQVRRHTDPLYRTQAASLSLSQALAIYSDLLTTIERHYADRDQAKYDKLYRYGLDEIRLALSDPTIIREYASGAEPAAIETLCDRITTEWTQKSINDARDARQAMRDLAWDIHLATGIGATLIVLEGAHGACQALDEYSLFFAPGRVSLDSASIASDLAAYGLILTPRDGGLQITRVTPDSWAASEGILPGDRITHVGKTAFDQLSLELAHDLIRGERAAVNQLTIVSPGAAARTVSLPEYLPSVIDVGMERDGVGYVRLASFQKATPTELDSALLRLRSEGMRALIIDLRGNSGGSFLSAVQVVERFLSQGVIVSTLGQLRGLTKTFTAQGAAVAGELPLVLLVDGETASAAEVVAGTLKDQNRAVLVGQTTFGKDSIQRLLHLHEGGAVRLTMARFFLPSNKSFAGVGVVPHVVEPRRSGPYDFQFEAALTQATRLIGAR